MKTQKVLVALAVLALVACGGVAQGSIVSVAPESAVGLTAASVDTFVLPLDDSWVLYKLGELTATAPATPGSVGSVDWNVTIWKSTLGDGTAQTQALLQVVDFADGSLVFGAVGSEAAPVVYAWPGLTWEVYLPEITLDNVLPGQMVTVEVYGRFKDMSADPVPEPATLAVWSLLGLSGAGMWMVRRRKGSGRAPWSEESRAAIHQIVGRSRA